MPIRFVRLDPSRALLGALLLSMACPAGSPSTDSTVPVARDLRALTIPHTASTAAAFGRLSNHAERNKAAAWSRAHYLLDLFDDARFRSNGDSLSILADVSGTRAAAIRARGLGGTTAALDFLLLEIDRVLRLDRLHTGAQAARTLLEFEHNPPRKRSQVFQRILQIRTIAREGGPVAHNARLRLHSYCHQAFVDATRARWSHRPRILAHCLYALFDADPEAYFSHDPNKRPPPPQWRDLLAHATDVLEPVTAGASRIAAAARQQRQALTQHATNNATQFPALPKAAEAGLPLVAHARYYDWTPILQLGTADHLKTPDHYADKMRMLVRGDLRQRIAVIANPRAPATVASHMTKSATLAGATVIEFLVATRQSLTVPQGDFWSGRIKANTIVRIGAIAIAVNPQAATSARNQPAGATNQSSRLGLHLVLQPDSWQIVSQHGSLDILATSTNANATPVQALRRQLRRVREAYRRERALTIVPGTGTTYGTLVTAAQAAMYTKTGALLFDQLSLSLQAPSATSDQLARTVKRRAAAHVRITPAILAAAIPASRACYQELLEDTAITGTLRLTLNKDTLHIAHGFGPPNLRTCIAHALKPHMQAKRIPTADLAFSLP